MRKESKQREPVPWGPVTAIGLTTTLFTAAAYAATHSWVTSDAPKSPLAAGHPYLLLLYPPMLSVAAVLTAKAAAFWRLKRRALSTGRR